MICGGGPNRATRSTKSLSFEYDRAFLTCAREDVGIFGTAKPEFTHREGINLQLVKQPLRKCGRQLRIDPDPHGLRGQNGVPQATTRKAQARRDVLTLQVR